MKAHKISVKDPATGKFEQILAIKGKDGKTPIRGEDYYTASDKQEIINNVVGSIPKKRLTV